MRLFALLALPAVVLVFNSGCFIPVLQLRADTVLTVRQGESKLADALSMGFSEVTSKSQDDCFTIQADGFSPREHETWIYWYRFPMVVEPVPGYGRHIRIVCCDMEKQSGPRNCRIQMLLGSEWAPGIFRRGAEPEYAPYECTASLQFSVNADTVSIGLTDLKLTSAVAPDDVICVSGKVAGKRKEGRNDSSVFMWFDEDWANAVGK